MGSPSTPQGGAASWWSSGSAVQEGQGQLRGWGEAEKGYRQEGGGVGWRLCGARAREGWPSQPGPRPTVALGVAGKDGAPVSSPSPSAGPSQLLSLPLRDPRALPLPERPEALPSQLSSGPSSAALVRASVQQGLPTGSRADGRTGGPGWAVSGRRASLRPSRAARPLSVLGRANGAGGRLRAPHTTVLTEGSERLSGPVISVGWYCCRFFLHTFTAANASCICFRRASLCRL